MIPTKNDFFKNIEIQNIFTSDKSTFILTKSEKIKKKIKN
jgi:hypothetical protein